MKILLVSFIIMIGLSACSAMHNSGGSYERANSASEKSHSGLDAE